MRLKKILCALCALVITLFGFAVFSACNPHETGDKTVVAVTILPQKALVKAVCGDLAEVVTLVPPGYSPGNYEPTPQEMADFGRASVYFTIGVPTETKNILPKAGDMEVVDLPAEVKNAYPDREFSPGKRDPHIWLSPKRAKVMVEKIAETMAGLDAGNSQIYLKNAQAYLDELDLIDAYIQTIFEDIESNKIIVFHPAYGYFADDYGLEMYALEQDGKEAAPQHLQDMIDLAAAEDIRVIFSQAEIDSNQVQAFAEEIHGEVIMLEPLSEYYIANLKRMADAISGALK